MSRRSSVGPLALGLALAGCAVAPAPEPARPPVAVVEDLPAGTVLYLAVSAPDDLPWRAVAPLWREAVGQSARFAVRRLPDRPPADAAVLRLVVDPDGNRLAAWFERSSARLAVGGAAVAAGQLGQAIDTLARTAREALGEVTAPPIPVTAALAAEPTVVDTFADAERLLADGALTSAARLFARCRARDGGSPAILDGVATTHLLLSRPDDAARIAAEALAYTGRLTPTRQHRLARTLLLARASARPANAPDHDRELRTLAEVFAGERPYDLEARLTLGLAANFLGEFALARRELGAVTASEPEHGLAWYHLGWAALASGDAKAAVAAFDRAAPRLPATARIVPQAIALYTAGDHERLRRELTELADQLANDGAPQLHDLRRMQIAHALLRGEDAEARRLLHDDFVWLTGHASVLDQRAGELAEAGIVLIRLGGGADLLPILATLQQQRPAPAVADTIAFLSGLLEVQRTGERAETAERQLGRGGDSVFGQLLAAYAHELRGELADQYTAISRAARSSDSPLVKTLLARCLWAMGRTAEAETLRTTLQQELLRCRLRERARHPLLGPELAFAFR